MLAESYPTIRFTYASVINLLNYVKCTKKVKTKVDISSDVLRSFAVTLLGMMGRSIHPRPHRLLYR